MFLRIHSAFYVPLAQSQGKRTALDDRTGNVSGSAAHFCEWLLLDLPKENTGIPSDWQSVTHPQVPTQPLL